MKSADVTVIGSGPNGLSAAITMAQAGHSVVVYEASNLPGGGARSEALTQPGFIHDICSAIHPLAVASPFFESLQLEKWGLEWIHPPIPLAHPLDNGESVLLHRSIEETAANLGEDESRYLNLMKKLVPHSKQLFSEIFKPVLHWPKHPFLLARFGLPSLLSAAAFGKGFFRGLRGQALFAGVAAHSIAPLEHLGTSAVGLMFQMAAHSRGWPLARGGAQKITDALIGCLQSLGGHVITGMEIKSLNEVPSSRWVFFDLTPRQIGNLLKDRLSGSQLRKFTDYSYGPGVFKMDWALSGPVPWTSKDCLKAGTLHLGGTFDEIASSEKEAATQGLSSKPYILLSQPTLFDPTRAPAGQHTLWAYCHVPNSSEADMTEAIENQIDRFAPGFRSRILSKRVSFPRDMEQKNSNLVGGDIAGGAFSLQKLLFRPFFSLNPYRLPIPGFYICSSSTPPGAGVHGMCGYNAALRALAE